MAWNKVREGLALGIVLIVSTIFIALLSGCTSQHPENDTGDKEVLKFTPVIVESSLSGYTGRSAGLFMTLKGNISDVFEKLGNAFTVFATYSDPGYDMAVTMAFTQPAAIIPIGKLPEGSYEAKLKVTGIMREEKGDKIIMENEEYAKVAFTVK